MFVRVKKKTSGELDAFTSGCRTSEGLDVAVGSIRPFENINQNNNEQREVLTLGEQLSVRRIATCWSWISFGSPLKSKCSLKDSHVFMFDIVLELQVKV